MGYSLVVKKKKRTMYGSTFMIIGSSMTQRAFELENLGFGIDLAHWYSRFIDIVIRGHSGYNSRWTLLGIKEMIGLYKPQIGCIFLGNNQFLHCQIIIFWQNDTRLFLFIKPIFIAEIILAFDAWITACIICCVNLVLFTL